MPARMKRFARALLLVFPLLVVAAADAGAQTLIYEHDERPMFSIEVPEGWLVDLDFEDEARAAGGAEGEEPMFRVVEISPRDGSHVWLGVWALPQVATLDEGLVYLASLSGDLFTDLEASEPQSTEFRGMAARTLKGTGVHKGESVELAMALFAPREGSIAAILYVGAPDAWRAHAEELAGMVASLEVANE